MISKKEFLELTLPLGFVRPDSTIGFLEEYPEHPPAIECYKIYDFERDMDLKELAFLIDYSYMTTGIGPYCFEKGDRNIGNVMWFGYALENGARVVPPSRIYLRETESGIKIDVSDFSHI